MHSLLKKHGIWSGSQAEARKHLKKQIVVRKEVDEGDGEDDLS